MQYHIIDERLNHKEHRLVSFCLTTSTAHRYLLSLVVISAMHSYFRTVYSRVSAQYAWIQSNVCAFSKYPPEWFDCAAAAPVPAPPTLSPIPEGKHQLLVNVTLDVNPTETGWRLSTLLEHDGADEVILYDMPAGSYTDADAGATFQYDVMVDTEQFYRMTIYETMGNGFGGTILVSDMTTPEMTVLMYEPGFTDVSGTIQSYGFYVGSSPPQILTLNLVFDVFPHELAFDISSDDDGTIFVLAWFGTFDNSFKTATATIPIHGPSAADRGYTLKIWDSKQDGICCQWGDGRYDLYLGDPNAGGTLLSGGSGDYGAVGTFPFVVMGDSSLMLSASTSLPSPFVFMRPSNAPTLIPAADELPSEGHRVPTLASDTAPTLASAIDSAGSQSIPTSNPPDSAKADAAVANSGTMNKSDGANNESDETVVSAAAYDTSSSTTGRIFSVWHFLVVFASSSWLICS